MLNRLIKERVSRGVRGGASPTTPPLHVPPLRGGGTACSSLPQSIYILHCIALTQTKEIKYILIHNNALHSFV